MIETAIKEDLILDKRLIIPKNKLDAIRIMNELHPVVGGQPTHEKDQPNDNNPILDLACTLANIHASGVGEHADLRSIQNELPSFFYGEGFISGISSLKGNGILAIFGHWRDGSGNYAIKQFYYTDKEISYRNAVSEDKWSEWIDVLTSNSQLDYNKLLNVPITSTLSDDKNKIASIFSVNEINRKANTAQVTANNADAKAVNAQRTADTSITNAKIADDKAVKAQARADAAFTRVKPIAEGGTGATTVANARLNLGLKSAALADLTSTLSDAKNLAASIFSVNEINRKANTAQTTANNAYTLAQSKQDKLNILGDAHNVLGRGAYGLAKKFEKDVQWSVYDPTMGSLDVFLDSLVTHDISRPNSFGFPLQLSNFANLGIQFLFPYRHTDPLVWRSNFSGKWEYAHALTSENTINQGGFIRDKGAGIAKSSGYKNHSRSANTKYTNTSKKVLRVQIGTYHLNALISRLQVDGLPVSHEGAHIGAENNSNLRATLIADIDPGSTYELVTVGNGLHIEFWVERECLI